MDEIEEKRKNELLDKIKKETKDSLIGNIKLGLSNLGF